MIQYSLTERTVPVPVSVPGKRFRRFRFRVRFLGKRFRRFRFPVPVWFLSHPAKGRNRGQTPKVIVAQENGLTSLFKEVRVFKVRPRPFLNFFVFGIEIFQPSFVIEFVCHRESAFCCLASILMLNNRMHDLP